MSAHADVSGHTLRALYLDLCAGRPPVMSQPYTGEPISPLLPPIEVRPPASLMPVYVSIVLGGLLVAGLLIVVITLIRPAPADNAALISTALTGLGVATLQALNFIKSSQAVVVATQNTDQIQTLHKSVNSGFEEFARLIRAEARAEGVKDAESKQIDAAAIEARIDAAVARGIADFQARQPLPAATTNVTVEAPEAVSVEEMQPQAAQAIAEAVRPPDPPEKGV